MKLMKFKNKNLIKNTSLVLAILIISTLFAGFSSASTINNVKFNKHVKVLHKGKFLGNNKLRILTGTLVRDGQSYPFTINLYKKTMFFRNQRVTITLRQVTSTEFTGDWVTNGKTVLVKIDTNQQTASFIFDRGIGAGLRTITVQPKSEYIYEGTLVMNGASYPLKVDLLNNDITFNFIDGNVHSVTIRPTNVNNTFYEGSWVYKAKSIPITFDKVDNAVSFNFPNYPGDMVVVSLERTFVLNPVKTRNPTTPLRSR